MCGRYFFTNPEEIYKHYGISPNEKISFKPNLNITPGNVLPIILKDGKGRHVRMVRWGLIPSWAKDEKIGSKLINARVETLDIKPSFKKSFISQRAVIPASGFYEWGDGGKKKVKYRIEAKSKGIISMAGLYDIWTDRKGKMVPTFTIVTKPAEELIRPIHDRTPVMLGKEGERMWLDYNQKDTDILKIMLLDQDSTRLEISCA
jgi:putative SOS response-associated peptidase YedK